MIVRKMTAEDIAEVVAIENQCFSIPWSEKSFRDSISRDDTVFLVCESESFLQETGSTIVAGYIGMYISFDEASITNVAVDPSCRKRGVGESLVTAAKQAVQEANAQKVFLEVRVSNEPAISLYKKAGFENLGIRKNFYVHPTEDAFIMSCDLNKV